HSSKAFRRPPEAVRCDSLAVDVLCRAGSQRPSQRGHSLARHSCNHVACSNDPVQLGKLLAHHVHFVPSLLEARCGQAVKASVESVGPQDEVKQRHSTTVTEVRNTTSVDIFGFTVTLTCVPTTPVPFGPMFCTTSPFTTTACGSAASCFFTSLARMFTVRWHSRSFKLHDAVPQNTRSAPHAWPMTRVSWCCASVHGTYATWRSSGSSPVASTSSLPRTL